MKFGTKIVHVGQAHDEQTGAVIPPINVSTNFVFDAIGQPHCYEYTRTGNSNREGWEAAVAAMESGKHAIAYASGSAAIMALLWLLRPQDHIILTSGCYGGTQRIIEQIGTHYGIQNSVIDTTDLSIVEATIRDNTRMILLETPNNPLLLLSNIRQISKLAQKAGALVVVDNTFLSPYYQRPLELGADISMHSTTKYLGGHSDILGGVLIANDDKVAERLRFIQSTGGSVPSPNDCWLASRSIKTLELRMRRHNSNASQVANYLNQHPKVEKVFFAGLPEHPHHELAKQQQLDPYGEPGFSGMVSFTIHDHTAIEKLLTSFSIFTFAISLGGVESLMCHPASMTHASISEADRKTFNISDNLIRASVGVEHIDDLLEDLDKALKAI